MGDQVRHNSSDAQGRHKLRPPLLLPESGYDLHKPGFRQDLKTPVENKATGWPWRKKGTLLSLILGKGSPGSHIQPLGPWLVRKQKRYRTLLLLTADPPL